MATAAVQTISSLLQQTRLDDHEEILKAANNVIKKFKTDTDVHHIRLIALLKLDRYDDALRVLEEGGDALKKQACLEWAYTLYKGGQLEKAEQAAREGDGARSLKHVEAQAVCLISLALGEVIAYTRAGIPIGEILPCGGIVPGAHQSEDSTR